MKPIFSLEQIGSHWFKKETMPSVPFDRCAVIDTETLGHGNYECWLDESQTHIIREKWFYGCKQETSEPIPVPKNYKLKNSGFHSYIYLITIKIPGRTDKLLCPSGDFITGLKYSRMMLEAVNYLKENQIINLYGFNQKFDFTMLMLHEGLFSCDVRNFTSMAYSSVSLSKYTESLAISSSCQEELSLLYMCEPVLLMLMINSLLNTEKASD